MIGFCDFNDLMKKAPKSKLVKICKLLDISYNESKKDLYHTLVLELGIYYDEGYSFYIEEMNEKIYNILIS